MKKELALLTLPAMLFAFSCKKKEQQETKSKPKSICQVGFASLTKPVQDEINQAPFQIGQSVDSSQLNVSNILCTETNYEWTPGYSEPLLLNTNEAIYPGVILNGNSLTNGGYGVITGDRGSLTISTNFQNLSETRSITVESATLSNVRNAISELFEGNVIGPTSANIAVSTSRVYNESSLKSALSAAVDVIPANISASFNWSSNDEVNRLVAKFTQVYYTIDIDLPSNPSNFWRVCPSSSMFNGVTPVVVSSVKYGRSAILTIESTASIDSIETAIDLAMKNVTLTADVSYQNIINTSNFNLTVIGGNAQDAIGISSFDGLRNYVSNGANYSSNNPAEPLSYKMKFLDDYSDAFVILHSEFITRQCEEVGLSQVAVQSYTTPRICPTVTSGNNQWGNNVDMTLQTFLHVSQSDDSKLILDVNWSLTGTSWSDGTDAVYSSSFLVYQAPAGKRILSIDTDTYSEISHSANSSSQNVYHHLVPSQSNSSVAELLKKFRCKIHTDGDDLGGCNSNYTHGYIDLNDILLTLEDE